MVRSSSNSPGGSRLVYSTEQGTVDHRGQSKSKKGTPPPSRGPLDDLVRVSRQIKGRKGKGVTVVQGLRLPPAELAKLAGELKKQCGSGGTAKNGVIEIQGDHRDPVIEALRRRGWKVKKAGG